MSKNKKVCLIDESYKTREDSITSNNEKCEDIYINGNKLNNYSEFKNYLINEWVSKPTRDDYYATQGLCHADEYVLITSYDPTDRVPDKNDKDEYKKYQEEYSNKLKTGEEDKDLETNNSKLDIIDSSGRRKSLIFDNYAHVGGIAYHEESGKFYVSNGSKVNVYSEEAIANASNNSTIKPEKGSFSVKEDVEQASYLTINNNELFVGKFNEKGDSKLAKYELDQNGDVIGDPEMYTVPFKKVQGMAVYEKDGKEYYLFSTSHGRTNDSNLIIATLEDGNFEKIDSVKLPSMAEQISITEDGKLGIVFESDSEYYKGASKEIGNVCYMDINKKINDLEEENEVNNLFSRIFDKDFMNSIAFVGEKLGKDSIEMIENQKDNDMEL